MEAEKKFDNLSILIPAAGNGERLGLGPKAMLLLKEKPLIQWVSNKALRLTDEVIIAAPPELCKTIQDLCPDCRCIEGGESRQESIGLLLNCATRKWVLTADITRPFTSLGLYSSVLSAAKTTGAAGAFITHDVAVAQLAKGKIKQIIKSTETGLFQAPQAFSRQLLANVYKQAEIHSWHEQSTLELVIRAGYSVSPVPGEKNNIKITTEIDWKLAQLLTEYLT